MTPPDRFVVQGDERRQAPPRRAEDRFHWNLSLAAVVVGIAFIGFAVFALYRQAQAIQASRRAATAYTCSVGINGSRALLRNLIVKSAAQPVSPKEERLLVKLGQPRQKRIADARAFAAANAPDIDCSKLVKAVTDPGILKPKKRTARRPSAP